MKLFIDTTKHTRAVVKVGKTEVIKTYEDPRGQDVLLHVDETLKKAKVKKEDLTEVEVNTGPGAFTSTRVGVAVANALGFALKIPVNGGKPGEFVKPIYDRPPLKYHKPGLKNLKPGLS